MRPRRWVSLDLARTLKQKFETDWQSIDIAERRAWARTVLAGVFAVMATLFVFILVFRTSVDGQNHFAWEERVLLAIDHGPIKFGGGVWLQTWGTDFMLVLVAIVAAGMAIWHDRPLLGVTILLALIFMDAVVRIGWLVLHRERPDIIAGGIASPGYHSFPSGHTAKSITLYGLLLAQWFQHSRSFAERVVVVALGVLITIGVPFGRLRMGVHWPTDVMAGYALGGLWLVFLLAALTVKDQRARGK